MRIVYAFRCVWLKSWPACAYTADRCNQYTGRCCLLCRGHGQTSRPSFTRSRMDSCQVQPGVLIPVGVAFVSRAWPHPSQNNPPAGCYVSLGMHRGGSSAFRMTDALPLSLRSAWHPSFARSRIHSCRAQPGVLYRLVLYTVSRALPDPSQNNPPRDRLGGGWWGGGGGGWFRQLPGVGVIYGNMCVGCIGVQTGSSHDGRVAFELPFRIASVFHAASSHIYIYIYICTLYACV